MTTTVALRVSGRDLFDPVVEDEILETLDAVTVTQRGRSQVLSLFVDDSQVVEQTIEAVRKIEQRIHGVRVVATERDPVNVTEIANRVGVSREAVRKWARSDDFPEPDGFLESASMDYWSWTKVVTWLWEQRRIDMDEQLPSMAQIAQIDHCLVGNPDAVSLQWHNLTAKRPTVRHEVAASKTTFHSYQPAATSRGGSQRILHRQGLVGTAAAKRALGK